VAPPHPLDAQTGPEEWWGRKDDREHRIVKRHEWRAMATRISATLFGDDDHHLEDVAAAVEDETRCLDTSVSRFDPTTEISRVNRESADRFVRVNVEVWEMIENCETYRSFLDDIRRCDPKTVADARVALVDCATVLIANEAVLSGRPVDFLKL
jgi:ApbE family